VLAARVLAEFDDDPTRFADRKRRVACNKRLRDALYLQEFATLTRSPGARAYYDAHRDRGHTHHQALRALANRLVGILRGCLRHRTIYDEGTAWPAFQPQLASAA
jgi:hypothetical protein